MRHRNIVLIGFMGCGKTTIGMALAQRLGWEFIDTDQRIEEEQGCDIKTIFARQGEAAFRQIERDCIASLSQRTQQIIATGGGVAKDPVNVSNLRRGGDILYLKLSPETLYERVKEDDTRPLLQPYTGSAKLERIRQLLAERRPMYESAGDIVVDCEGMDPEKTVDYILDLLKNP